MELRKMTADEYKHVIKDMLGYVHNLCVKNNIRYFAAYGTLLGAIRHDGFIPWDDDIDIWMEASDYQRFVKILAEESSDYYTLSPENSPYYYFLMCRICAKSGILRLDGILDVEELGPFIDVFQLHKAPEELNERMAFYAAIKQANKDVRYSLPLRYFKTLRKKIRTRMLLNFPKRFKNHIVDGTAKVKIRRAELVSKYDRTDSTLYYSVSETRCSDKLLFQAEVFDNLIPHKFEDIEVLVPKDYDALLTRLYGDYMTPPPEDKRTTRHHFTPYWR